MKKILTILCLIVGLSQVTNAQLGCTNTTENTLTTFTPISVWYPAGVFAGRYTKYNVVAGVTYEWSTCSADGGNAAYDTELTLTDVNNVELDYNDDFCGQSSKITWTATFTGTVRVHLTEHHCQTNQTYTVLVFRVVTLGCVAATHYPTTTFTPTSVWQTTATNIYAGEYSVYNVVAGKTYEWTTCVADGGLATVDVALTLTDINNNEFAFNDNFCSLSSKITWTATITGLVRVHLTEAGCQTNSINTTIVYREKGINLTLGTNTFTVANNVLTIALGVDNDGSEDAAAFDVRFYASTNTTITVSDQEIGVESYAGLTGNTPSTRTVIIDLCNIAGFSPSGNYYIGFLIDEPNQIAESDETDNSEYFTNPLNINCVADYTVTTLSSPSAGGSTTGGGTFADGTSVTITATPNPGWVFDRWSRNNGNTASTNLTYTFNISSTIVLTAEFLQQFTVTLTADTLQGGTISGGGTYNSNQQVTVTASPNPGWLFEGWYENNQFVSDAQNYAFAITGNRDLMANFDINTNTNSIAQNVDLTIYPNPARDFININIEHQSLDFDEIHVYNLQGQLVKTANLNGSNNTMINLDELSAGTYLVQIFTLDNSQYIIQKVIKQ